jgi:hypothetical protein
MLEDASSPKTPRPEEEEEEAAAVGVVDEWQCPVCLDLIEDDQAKTEFVVLSCKHKIHLACWLPCALPIGGGGTAQLRHIEDRLGRKCPICRGEFSQLTQKALKPRREVIRTEERADRRDESLLNVLRAVADRGLTHPALRELDEVDGERRREGHGEEQLAAMRAERMPLDGEMLFEALTSTQAVDDMERLTRAIRAELQAKKLSASGMHETIVRRLVGEGCATAGFFAKCRRDGLIKKEGGGAVCEVISRSVEDLEEAERRSSKQKRRSVIQLGGAGVLLAGIMGNVGMPVPPRHMRPPVPAPPLPPSPPARLAEHMQELASMGFTDEARNRTALMTVNGNLEAAIGLLVNM